MAEQSSNIGYLYVNGLGRGDITLKDRMVRWWWARAGRTIEHAQVDWYDGRNLAEKERQVREKVEQMLQTFGAVAIIGGSAGGGLALNVFSQMKDKNICAVTAHARVKVGGYEDSDRKSLFRRAKLGTKTPSQAFYDSVTKAESETIPSLTDADKSRLLNLTQLTDMVVPPDLMQIEGVQTHQSLAFGHAGGFLAHLLADRDLIIRFAEQATSNPRNG